MYVGKVFASFCNSLSFTVLLFHTRSEHSMNVTIQRILSGLKDLFHSVLKCSLQGLVFRLLLCICQMDSSKQSWL